ncbi:MAG: ferrous iron transport protein B, partial [Planctomycetes bacterium]|nr:ferrous iron transport protein B [Planctomycetota bacterium]
MREIVVALAGNPNSGKTTVFNALTGARQHVGNYPGVTVEKKEGFVESGDVKIRLVDLPGTYSLSAQSPEEVVARNFVVHDKPDVVAQVVDASNLDRNLYLTTQLMDLGVKLVIILNMVDVAKHRGLDFDIELLSKYLKAPVIPTVGNRAQGINGIVQAVKDVAAAPKADYTAIQYPAEFTSMVDAIDAALTGEDRKLADEYPPKWLAARLLENDSDITNRVHDHTLLLKVGEYRAEFEKQYKDSPEIRSTEAKFGWTSGLAKEATKRTAESRIEMSDKVDGVLLNRYLGIPIFLAMMYVMFQLVFTLAEKPMEWIEEGFGALGTSVAELWPRAVDSPLRDLLVDGIIGGVGGVLVFLPNILLLFLAIAFLEGTGYMARAAFLMDGLMHRIGLHGKSFIPMLLGFGCTVPAIMGTRTLENRRDRFTTIMVLPFMSCGARLPIYALIIPAFFPQALQAWMLWIIYLIGIVFAIIGAKILRSTVFKGDSESFVMELPPYRMPTLRTVLLLMWDRAREYVKKAGTIILGASIILWAMTAYPKKPEYDFDYDGMREQVKQEYIASVQEIGTAANIPLLGEWAETKEEYAETESEFWTSEPGYAQAELAFAGKMDELFSRSDGERLRVFAESVETLDAIEAEFEESVGEEEDEESLAFRNAVAARDAAFAAVAADDPDMLAAIAAYREETLADFQGKMEEIDNAEAGEDLAYSISGRVGRFIEPILRPIGFDWRIGTAIIGSFAAKEVFVAQMGIVYSVGEADEESDSLRQKLQDNYTPLQGFCMMIYALLSLPCVATIAVAKRETGGWSWAIIMGVGLTVIAWI